MREALNVMGDGRYKDALDKLGLEVPMRWSALCVRVQTYVMPGERLRVRETMRVESDSRVFSRWNCEHEA